MAAWLYRIGADENGLGPRLGPMTTTAVLAKIEPSAHERVTRPLRGGLRDRLGDSKRTASHGNTTLAEAWARALVARITGLEPKDPDDLVAALAIAGIEPLLARCPKGVSAQCWGTRFEGFAADAKQLVTARKDLDRLAGWGIDLCGARTVVSCARALNDAADEGQNRFVVDLHAMERLVLWLAERAGAEVLAVCGKVGGFSKYEPAFGPLGGRLCTVIEESRARSSYRFAGLGQVDLVRDADGRDLLVMLASMVGKYLRELLMARVVAFYRQHHTDLPDASGYHDPVTARFIAATALTRRRLRIPKACFERRAVGEPPRERRA